MNIARGKYHIWTVGCQMNQADSQRVATMLEGLGWDVRRVPQTDVEAGIKRAREIFPRVWFNKERAARLVRAGLGS